VRQGRPLNKFGHAETRATAPNYCMVNTALKYSGFYPVSTILTCLKLDFFLGKKKLKIAITKNW
jgi:hypothetical protein